MAGLGFQITADNRAALDSFRSTEQAAQNMGNTIQRSGNAIDRLFGGIPQNANTVLDAINAQKSAIASLEQQYRTAKSAFDALGNGVPSNTRLSDQEIQTYTRQYAEAKKKIEETRKALDAEKKTLQELEKVYQQFNSTREKSADSYLTQMRNIREEMARLREAGKTEDKRYQELQEELRRVGTAYRQVRLEQQALTRGGAQIAGLISGMTGFSGVVSAGTGVVGLFVKSNERLAEIQTKLQSVMAITFGLQQIQNTLHQTSAFRMDTVTKATQLWRSANLATGTSLIKLGLSANVARAAAISLNTFGIGLLIAGVAALIYKYKEYKKEQEENVRLNKIVTDSLKSAALEGEKSALKEATSLKLLYNATQNETKSKKERLRAAQEMQKLYPDYFGNLSKEEILAGKGAAAYQNLATAIIAAAKARAAQDKIVENETKILELDAKRTELEAKKTSQEASLSKYTGFSYDARVSQAQEFTKDKMKSDVEKLNKDIDSANNEIEKLNEANKKLAESVKIEDLLYDSKKGAKDYAKAESETEKARKQAQKTADDKLKAANNEAKALLDSRAKFLENEEALLNLEDESFEKRQKQLDINNQKALLAIDKRTQELIEKRQDAERKQWDIDNPKGAKGSFAPKIKTVYDLSAEDQAELANSTIIASKIQEKATDDLLKSLLDKYQDYNARRLEINKKFEADLAALESLPSNQKNDAAIAQLKKDWQESLSAIDIDELRDSLDWQKVFGDLDRVSSKSIEDLRSKLKDYVKEVGKNLTPTDLKTLTDAIEQLDKKYAELKPNKAFTDSFKEYKKATDNVKKLKKELDDIKSGKQVITGIKYDKETGAMIPILKSVEQAEKDLTEAQDVRRKSLADLGLAMQSYASKAQQYINVGKEIVSTLEDFGVEVPEGIKMTLEGLDKVSSGMEDISKGMMSANPILMIQGGVKAVGGVVKTIKGLFGGNVNKAHREALKLLEKQREEQERIYKLEKLRSDLQYKKGDTVFGSDNWGKAQNSADVYAKSVKELEASMKKLGDIDIVNGSKKKGWGPWKKRKDVYDSILKVYPDLVDGEGKLNTELAKTILATRQMSDENKSALQSMIDNAEQVENAYATMKDYLTDIFGNLGTTITDVFVDSFAEGKDAMKGMFDSAGDMLEKFVKDFVYSMTLAPIMQKASEDMMKVQQDLSMNDKQKLDSMTDIIGNLVDDALKQQDLANELLGYAQEKAAEKGMDIFQPDSKRKGDSQGIQNITQDSANRLEGIGNNVLIKLADMRNISEASRLQLVALNGSFSKQLELSRQSLEVFRQQLDYYKQIAQNTGDTAKILGEIHKLGMLIRN